MKLILCFVLIMFCIISCVAISSVWKVTDSAEIFSVIKNKSDWKLVFQDEFNSGNMPDTHIWTYEKNLVRNKEEQNYMEAEHKNSRIEEGLLILEAHHEKVKNPNFNPNSNAWSEKRAFSNYSSASVNTSNIEGWTYGRFEISAKLPRGQGVWPAIWMLGKNITQEGYPHCGEIDIMEHVNSSPCVIYGTLHYPVVDSKGVQKLLSKGGVKKFETQDTMNDMFHLYAMEWDEKTIKFFFDDDCFGTLDITDIPCFHKPQFLLLNLAVGGAWGGRADSEIFPKKYEIDFVRIFQKK